ARYGKADERIHRVLDSTVISRGVTRAALTGILVLGAPLVYCAATLAPQAAEVSRASQATVAAATSTAATAGPRASAAPHAAAASSATASAGAAVAAPEPEAPQSAAAAQASSSRRINRYVIVSNDSVSGSWDSRDHMQFNEWKARYGNDFVWFRHD